MSHSQRVNAEHLIDFAAAVYAGAGMPADDAQLIADSLVQSDLWGINRMACCAWAGIWSEFATASCSR